MDAASMQSRPEGLTAPDTTAPAITAAAAATGQRTQCSHCGRRFARPFTLKRHLQVHETPTHAHRCPHCGDIFSREDVLTRHLVERHTATGDKVECEACGRTVLRRYWAQHHGGPICRKWKRALPTTASSAPVLSSSSSIASRTEGAIAPQHQPKTSQPMDDFWCYADILVQHDLDAELVRRGAMCASTYVVCLYLQGDDPTSPTAEVERYIGLSYAILRDACSRLTRTTAPARRRDALAAMNQLGLVDHHRGDVAAAQQHFRAFAAAGGRALTESAIDYRRDMQTVGWAVARGVPEARIRDVAALSAAYADFLAVGVRLGVYPPALREALLVNAQKLRDLQLSSMKQQARTRIGYSTSNDECQDARTSTDPQSIGESRQ